jgi:nitrogen fixation protein NifU and related proteins
MDLYQAVLLDHARQPRNHRKLEHAAVTGKGNDPLCGDSCTVYLDLAGGIIKDMGFQGAGCAIMLASASLMTVALVGKTVGQAQAILGQFQGMLAGDDRPGIDDLGDLAALAGVRAFPSRLKCAFLPWNALRAALRENLGEELRRADGLG